MELLKLKIYFVLILSLFLHLGCAKNLDSVLNEPTALPKEEKISQNFLSGQFKREDGTNLDLATLNDKPVLIFFVGEFCGACRKEAEHLKEMVTQRGLPTKIHMISVMLEVETGTISDWFVGISPPSPNWILGSDGDLSLYFSFFQQIVTPSVIYFDPQTQILKRRQTVVPLSQLEQETGPWY